MKLEQLIGEATEYDKKVMLEVKKPKSWLKSVSAFANGVGGVLIFGIADDDSVVGIDDVKKTMEVISEQIKVKMDPTPEVLLKAHLVDGKEIVTLEVYRGEETPYYYVGEGNYTAYVRIGNESVMATATDLKRLVLRGKNRTYDSLVTDYSFDDYSFSKLKAAYYKKTKKSMEMKDFESFGIVDKNGMLTNAGALLADESPIYCSRLFCTRWNGFDKASGVIDALDDEEYTGSLILLLEEGMNFARRNSKKMWKKESDRRVEYPEYPERSIFEGLVNGLVHRDYLDMGSEVHIDIFDDRLEIYSPGGMYDGTLIQDRDIDNVPSKRRNPVVADIFSRLDYMERRGSGFKKIMQAYEVEPNYTEDKKPVFYSNATEFRVILKNLNFTDEVLNEKNEVLDEVLNEVLDSGRTEMEIKVIKAILSSPRIKQKELAEQVGISVSTIQRTIKKLVKEGKIVRVNGKRDGYWKVL
ncbi:MAG: winged helix-turn-helix transcriptional regulator [Lachnospiraceae bacterium]|nr:winged helix-turn-helix transcriptional regulator [Lachnospiraceae bacterium]